MNLNWNFFVGSPYPKKHVIYCCNFISIVVVVYYHLLFVNYWVKLKETVGMLLWWIISDFFFLCQTEIQDDNRIWLIKALKLFCLELLVGEFTIIEIHLGMIIYKNCVYVVLIRNLRCWHYRTYSSETTVPLEENN